MKIITYTTNLFFLALITTSCATQPKDVSTAGGYVRDETQSVIIIGMFKSDQHQDETISISYGAFTQGRSFELGDKELTVKALSVPRLDDFSIGTIIVKKMKSKTDTTRLKKSKSIFPEKQGIYYYGTIIRKDNKFYLITDAERQISKLTINLARKKYKNVFTKLKPVNFKFK